MKKAIALYLIACTLTISSNSFGMLTSSLATTRTKKFFSLQKNFQTRPICYCICCNKKNDFADFLHRNNAAHEMLRIYVERTKNRNCLLNKKMESSNPIVKTILLQNQTAERIEALLKLNRNDLYYKKNDLANLVYQFNDLEKQIDSTKE